MHIYPWREVEIALESTQEYTNPYMDLDVWADFTHESGVMLRRPAFWDGERSWKIQPGHCHGAPPRSNAISTPLIGRSRASMRCC